MDTAVMELKMRLKELNAEEPLVSMRTVSPSRRRPLTTAQFKENMETIKRLWREKNSMPDPKVAYLEIGKLLRVIGNEEKGIAYILKAIKPYDKHTNSMVPLTDEQTRGVKRIERARVHMEYYHGDDIRFQ
jgi:hypothetical protein